MALVCLLAGGVRPTAQEADVQALATAILAAPAQDRARLLDERGVKPNHALVDAMVILAGRRMSAGDFTAAAESGARR